jgi:hypothetical protein
MKEVRSLYAEALKWVESDMYFRKWPVRRRMRIGARNDERQTRKEHYEKGIDLAARLKVDGDETAAKLFDIYRNTPSEAASRAFSETIIRVRGKRAKRSVRPRSRVTPGALIILITIFIIAVCAYTYLAFSKTRPLIDHRNAPPAAAAPSTGRIIGEADHQSFAESQSRDPHGQKKGATAGTDPMISACPVCLGLQSVIASLGSEIEQILGTVQPAVAGLVSSAVLQVVQPAQSTVTILVGGIQHSVDSASPTSPVRQNLDSIHRAGASLVGGVRQVADTAYPAASGLVGAAQQAVTGLLAVPQSGVIPAGNILQEKTISGRN